MIQAIYNMDMYFREYKLYNMGLDDHSCLGSSTATLGTLAGALNTQGFLVDIDTSQAKLDYPVHVGSSIKPIKLMYESSHVIS